MGVEVKQIMKSDVSGKEIQPTTGDQIQGYIIHGNVYVATLDLENRGGLVGDSFPQKKTKSRITTRKGHTCIDGVALHYMTPEDVLNTFHIDPEIALRWADSKLQEKRSSK